MKTKNLPNNNSVRCINTLLMMIFSLIIIPTVSSAVITFTPASNQMDYFPLSPEANDMRGFEIDYSFNATSATSEIIAIVHDGHAAGIEVTDGAGTLGFYQFNNPALIAAYAPTSFGSPTGGSGFYNADVTLLREGTKAIATFMVDNIGAYVVEFDIIALPGFIDVQPSFQLQEPINANALTINPRVDGDFANPSDPNDDRFAVSSLQDIGGSLNDVFFSVYDAAGPTFAVNPGMVNVQVPATSASTLSLVRTNPDISLSNEFPTFDPVLVVAYQEFDPSNQTFVSVLVDEHHPIIGTTAQVHSSGFTIPFGSYADWKNRDAKITGENELNGLSTPTMKWALAISAIEYDSSVAHLWYANHTTLSAFEIDAPFSTSPLIENRTPSLAWMSNTGLDDAYVTWSSVQSFLPGLQVEGVMAPATNGFPFFNTWENVSPWQMGGYVSTAAASSPVLNQYVTAFLLSGKVFYKTRPNGSTGF